MLGPLLFLIFRNDLANVSKHLTFYLFADETNVYFKSSDLLTIQKVVNQELHKVHKWLEGNRLALNIEKTSFVLHRSAQHKLTDHIYLIVFKKIKQESHFQLLSVLNSTLSWKYHLTELSKKLARTAGLFYKIRHHVPKDTLLLLYHAVLLHFLPMVYLLGDLIIPPYWTSF